MRYLILCTVVLALSCFQVFAGDLFIKRNWTPQPGEEYRQTWPGTYQRYNKGVPDLGHKLQRQENRLQIYNNWTPQPGDYYQKQNDGTWQRYENFVPQYGDSLDRW